MHGSAGRVPVGPPPPPRYGEIIATESLGSCVFAAVCRAASLWQGKGSVWRLSAKPCAGPFFQSAKDTKLNP